jgi:hypothetical protein
MTTRDTNLSIPLLDLSHWRRGGAAERAALADELDDALSRLGFLLLTGHGLSDLAEQIRAEAHRFFLLPSEKKARYATTLGGRGWLPLGAEANAFYGYSPSCPDLKEGLAFGRELPTGNPKIDRTCSTDNVWPSETPTLRALCTRYTTALYQIHAELLVRSAPPPLSWPPADLTTVPIVVRTPSTSTATRRCVTPVPQATGSSRLARTLTGAPSPFSTVNRGAGGCKSRPRMATGS